MQRFEDNQKIHRKLAIQTHVQTYHWSTFHLIVFVKIKSNENQSKELKTIFDESTSKSSSGKWSFESIDGDISGLF